jgi:hypothetical protein
MRHVVLPLALLSGIFADGFFYSAHAQCAPTDKIYIDPRLVPKRPQISAADFGRIMAAPGIPDAIKLDAHRKMMEQNQPIVIPYETGKVLVHPTNPCIQQYIP